MFFKGTISPTLNAILRDRKASRKFFSHYFDIEDPELKRKFISDLLSELPTPKPRKNRNLLEILLGVWGG